MPTDPPPPTDPADEERRSRLSRRYRRWLLAYPRAFRRERGPEVLGTLLDLSEGRDRPARRQVTSLLYRGLVTRFALGRRTVLVAVLAALLVGVSGSSLGAWLAWQHPHLSLPDHATAAAAARAAWPGTAPVETSRNYHLFWNPNSDHTLHGGSGDRPGRVFFDVPPPRHYDALAMLAASRDRLRAGGWRVTEYHPTGRLSDAPTLYLAARRGGLTVTVDVDLAEARDYQRIQLSVLNTEPVATSSMALRYGLAGAALGFLLGWLTAVRIRRHGMAVRLTYLMLAGTTLVLLTPAVLLSLPIPGHLPGGTGSVLGGEPPVYWTGFTFYGAEPMAMLSALTALAAVVLALWPMPLARPAGWRQFA